MKAEEEEQFRLFVLEAGPVLRRMAVAVCRDPHRADDAVQEALIKLFVAWPRISRDVATPLAYARTIVARGLIDDHRRPFRRREVVADMPPDAVSPDRSQETVDRDWLRSALQALPARQRMAVVLRHLECLSVTECARVLDMSESNVKAATREGMAALRTAATAEQQGAVQRWV